MASAYDVNEVETKRENSGRGYREASGENFSDRSPFNLKPHSPGRGETHRAKSGFVARALRDMRIGKKLALGFGILLAMLVFVAGAGYWGSRSVSNMMLELLQNDAKLQQSYMNASLLSLELRRYEKDAILALESHDGFSKAMENWKAIDERMHENLDQIDKPSKAPEDKDALNSIRLALKDYEQGFQDLMQRMQPEPPSSAKVNLTHTNRSTQANEAMKPYKDAIHFVEDHLRQEAVERASRMEDRAKSTEALLQRTSVMLFGVVLLGLVVGGSISVAMTRSIARPVADAVEAAQRIVKGERNVEVDADRADEMGQLMLSVNQMSEEFGSRLEAVARISSMVDNAPFNVMYAGMDLKLQYMNKASHDTLKKIEHLLPIKVDEMLGREIDIFHKNPEHQRKLLATDRHLPHEALIEIGSERMLLRVNAVYNDQKQYIGPMVTWELATQRLMAEQAAKQAELEKQREQAELSEKVGRILEVVQAAAKGDLTLDVSVKGADAIGQMGEGLQGFFTNLRGSVAAIARNAQGLASASEELSAVSQQMSVAAEETSSQANVVSAAAEQVDKNLQTVATGTEEMSASIKEIAKNATEAAKVAAAAVGVADRTNQTVMKLGESSAEIGEVIKVITSIAQQTNLLALNATIEAARAGEAGKGFAVVANEVKELAKETAKATEDISRKIETIQTDTKEAVEAIGSISTIINQVNDISSTIASAVEEQNATTNEMSRNVTDAARGSGEIAKNISGVAEAAQSATHGASDSQQAAQQLAKMANELKELTVRFKY